MKYLVMGALVALVSCGHFGGHKKACCKKEKQCCREKSKCKDGKCDAKKKKDEMA